MANVFCSSTGSNTAPYETWAKAATTFTTAVGAASASGDIIAVDAASPPADIAANTTWTFLANVSVIASTNTGTSTITPTTMGTSTYLGASGATSYSITLAGAFKVYFYGITFRNSGTTNLSIVVGLTDGGHFELENCYIWLGTTNASAGITFGGGGNTSTNTFTRLKNSTIRFGSTSHGIVCSSNVEIEGGSISSAGSAPSSLIRASVNANSVTWTGVDLTHVGSGTLVASQTTGALAVRFVQCRFPTTLGAVMAIQSPANKGSAKVWVHDCNFAVVDTHGLFGYYDAFGSIESDIGTYLTAGAAGQSWKITTTSACSFTTPFVTPWISLYSAGASATTYKLELLRNNGTATTYNDAEVWGEFSVKDNSGFTNSDVFTDRQALVDWAAGTTGTAQTAGAGTGSWTIAASSSPASFIVDSGTTITQAEAGHIRARVVVGLASVSNLFLDPQIRT